MSNAVVLKRPIARIDLAGCYAHIWERSPDAANRFRQAAEATLQRFTSALYTARPEAC